MVDATGGRGRAVDTATIEEGVIMVNFSSEKCEADGLSAVRGSFGLNVGAVRVSKNSKLS